MIRAPAPAVDGVPDPAAGPRHQDRPTTRTYEPSTTQLRRPIASSVAPRPAANWSSRARSPTNGAGVRPVAGKDQLQPEDAVPDERPGRRRLPGRDRPVERRGRVHRGGLEPAGESTPATPRFVAAYTKKVRQPAHRGRGPTPTPQARSLAAAVRAVGRIDQKALATWLHTHTVEHHRGAAEVELRPVTPEGRPAARRSGRAASLQIVAPKSAANHQPHGDRSSRPGPADDRAGPDAGSSAVTDRQRSTR